MSWHVNLYFTIFLASLVLLLGRFLIQRIAFLKEYSIPEPVVGGLVVAVFLLVLRQFAGIRVDFESSTMQSLLMLTFFASIGLNADIASLRRGGKKLGIFVSVVVALLIVQNTLGVAVAHALGINPLMGLLAGSVTLSGGHGTGVAWGKVFTDQYGFNGATEVAMACATFGLVLGGLIGGPVAHHLLSKIKKSEIETDEQVLSSERPETPRLITSSILIETIAMYAICLSVGQTIANALSDTFASMPTFVCVLFVGTILRNALARVDFYHVEVRAVSLLGNISLSLFLALALMTLALWELAALAVPMLVILSLQALTMALFATFVTFPVMGKNYDAAVIAAGHCGFGLGATPTAIANMQAITTRFGPSHIAFLIVPMVGAFFIDIANAIVIKLFLLLPVLGG